MSAPQLKRWETTTSTGSHFDALDGLRGVAILLVVSFHALYVNPADGLIVRLVGCIFVAGWMGVPMFFVLSGFLISYPFFLKRNNDPQFWFQRGYVRRRLGKILPPFYLSILFFIAFYWWRYHDPAYLQSAWKWALGLGNFISISPNFNGVYWSLIVESHFYVILPLLFWLTRGLSVRRTSGVLFFILFVIPLIVRQLVWPTDVYVLPDYTTPMYADIWLKLSRFPCQLDYFAWGVVFSAVYVSLNAEGGLQLRALSVLGYVGMALMAVTLIFWGVWVNEFDIRTHVTRWSIETSHLLPAVAVMLMLFFLFDPRSLGARFLSLSWLRFTGIISFEWFLFHGPIVSLFEEHAGHSNGNVLAYAERTLLPLALTFVLAALVYRYFSLPILNRVRDSLKPTTRAV